MEHNIIQIWLSSLGIMNNLDRVGWFVLKCEKSINKTHIYTKLMSLSHQQQ